jgi:hypothetical protein
MYRKDIVGWLLDNEVTAIEKFCELCPKGHDIIEVGPFAGRTTQIIADICKSSTIYSIDPWPVTKPGIVWEGQNYEGPGYDSSDIEGIFQKEILDVFSNVVKIKGQFPEDLPTEYTRNIGWVHWDTDNVFDDNAENRMREQFSYAWSLLPVGGLLSGHTFAGWMPKVVTAVRNFAEWEAKAEVILPPNGSTWYLLKR